eukprot:32664-Chlamydomonas_euryale.AAC.3
MGSELWVKTRNTSRVLHSCRPTLSRSLLHCYRSSVAAHAPHRCHSHLVGGWLPSPPKRTLHSEVCPATKAAAPHLRQPTRPRQPAASGTRGSGG